MKQYKIITGAEFSSEAMAAAQTAEISEYVWGGAYRPRAFARMLFVQGDGFYVQMTCEEQNPRAVYQNYFDPVYKDSALECFLAFDKNRPAYLNVEMNARGVFLSEFGDGRGSRVDAQKITGGLLAVTAEKEDGLWRVTAHIPLSAIEKLFNIPGDTFQSGYSFRGNFYKCGDDTDAPHYGMWNPIAAKAPDFHRPECFGEFVMA